MLNITLQRQWLDILEESKKKKAARDKQKKEAMLLEQQVQVASNTAVEEKNRTYLYKYSWYMPQWSRRQKSVLLRNKTDWGFLLFQWSTELV